MMHGWAKAHGLFGRLRHRVYFVDRVIASIASIASMASLRLLRLFGLVGSEVLEEA